MDQEIKSAVNDIMQACKSLNSMIFPQDETGTKLANEVIADLCRYIVHLTLADGVMTGDELQAINYYFDTNYTAGDIQEYSEAEETTADGSAVSIPLSFNYFIRIDNMFFEEQEMVTGYSKGLTELYKKLGMDIICCDSNLDMTEYKVYNDYIQMLEDFAQANLNSEA